jgi:hypothetical protein
MVPGQRLNCTRAILIFFFCWIVQVVEWSIYESLNFEDVKLIRYQFWCTRCAFRLIKSLQRYSGQKCWKSEQKKLWKYKELKKPILWHEIEPIRRRIELCMRTSSLKGWTWWRHGHTHLQWQGFFLKQVFITLINLIIRRYNIGFNFISGET